MRITGFHVDGFGLLHDQAVDGIGPGTTVVLGPNEAGKSTLHAFLVRTLFGHPRSNDAGGRHRHEPLRGGRHGGVVHCRDDTGDWQVHRHTEGTPRLRVVAPDGSEATGTDAVLPLLGRTVDEARYEQVFAIDLDDLAGVGSLGGGALDDLLFDAATVGTGRSLRAARDEAVARRDELWTPAATKRPLAAAVRRRARERAALAAARDAARANLDVRRRLDEAAARVDRLAEQQQEQLGRAALLERVVDAWPAWSRLEELDGELRALPATVLDGDLVAGARDAVATVAAAAGARAELEERRTALATELAAVAVDEAALAVAEEVDALSEQAGVQDLALEQLAAAEQARDDARRAVAAAMAELGTGWDEARVRAVATDAPTRHRLEVLGGDLLDATRAAADAEGRAADAARVAARRADQVEARERALPPAPPPGEVDRAEAALAVLRAGVPTLERAAALEGEGFAHDGRREVRGGGPAWLGGLLLGLAVVALVATVLVELPAAAAVAVLLAAAGAYLLARSSVGAGAPRAAAPRGGSPAASVADLAPGWGAARDRLARDVAAAAAELGLRDRPSLGEVEQRATGVVADRALVRDAAEARRALQAAREEAAEAAGLAREAAALADDRVGDRRAASEAWEKVCDEVGLDPADDVRVTLARHDRVRTASRALAALDTARGDVARHAERVDRHRSAVAAVLARAGDETAAQDVEGAAAVRRLPVLRARVRAARDAARRREDLAAAERALVAELDELEVRLAAARGTCRAALAAVGAEDEDHLDELVTTSTRRTALDDERARVRRELARLLGEGPRGAEGRALLATADPTAWEQQLVAAREAADTLRAERDEALAQRTQLEATLRGLGGDDAVPAAEQALVAAEVAVGELAERWAVADTAARLLEETVARFERDQQPRVLTRASELFERATGSQWAQVRRLDGQVVVARTPGGDPVPAGVLSRGTREQLWLCLRLALAEDLASDRPLPLLVDDLLGTSDPERSLHVARVLAEVARRQQVWLFTCHPRTADLVVSTDPTAGVLRLRRGGRVVGLDRRDDAGRSDGPADDPAPRLELD